MQFEKGIAALSGWLAGRVWQSGLSGDLKPLAAALADCGNDDGENIYPSVEYLVWLMGRSERTIRAGLSQLRSMNVIALVGDITDPQKVGRGYSVSYRLIVDNLPARLPWKGKKKGRQRGAKSAEITVIQSPAKIAAVSIDRSPEIIAGLAVEGVQETTERGAGNDMEGVQNSALFAELSLNDPSSDPSSDPSMEPSEPAARPPRKLTEPQQLAERHRTLYKQQFGEEPKPIERPQSVMAAGLVTRFGFGRAMELLDAFFETRDKWLHESDHQFGTFYKFIDKIVVELKNRPLPKREARTANEARAQVREQNIDRIAEADFHIVGSPAI